MLDVLTGLRKVRENIPRKFTVTDVVKERRELVSGINLFLSMTLNLSAVLDVLCLPFSLRMPARFQGP